VPGALEVQNLLHTHTIENVTLTQKHVLVVAGLCHNHTLENVTLIIPGLWVSLDGIRFYLN
jgi:hypothetical protein